MKLIITSAILLLYTYSQAQTSKRFKETASKYFIAIPNKNKLQEWISSLKDSKTVTIDSGVDAGTFKNILLRATLNEKIAALPHYDSARIIVGEVKSFYTYSVNRRITNETSDIDFYLDQTFYFSQDKITQADWENICKAVIKDFKKSTLIIYPSTTKNDPYNNVWFQTNSTERPILMMRYGKMMDKPSYLLSLNLIIQ